VVEFGEWLCEQVIKAVPHRHFIFSIPKILRRYFLYNRGLLSELSRCGWESLKAFFQEAVPVEDPVLRGEEDAVPGAVIAIQSFGDFLTCFYRGGIPDSTSFVGQRYNPEMGRPGKTSLVILSVPLSLKRARPGATRLSLRFRLCIIPNLAFKVNRIGDRSGPGNDLYSGGIQGPLPVKRWEKGKEFRCFRVAPQKTAGCKHSRLCAHTFPTKENRWFVTMDIIVMCPGANGKTKTRMNGCPVSWNRKRQPKNTERTGPS